jgi:tripartite-type tricarboxylate transporter receptor subunit TctC
MAKSGSLLGGSSGAGSPGHLALELFNMMAGTWIVHVAYKGSAPALIDVIAGNIHLTFATAATAAPLMKAGKIRGLGVTTRKRSTVLPELPTISESGLAGFEVSGWYGVLAPAGTPRSIIDRLNAEIVKALQMPEVRQNMSAQSFDISPSTPEQFAAFIKSEIAKWGKVVKYSGAKAN